MIDESFRRVLPVYSKQLIALYIRWALTPNRITFLGMLGACLAALAVAVSWNVLAVIVWWLSRILDGTDGILARETGQESPYGAFLDIVCDMFAYGIMIVGFFAAYPDFAWYWLFILFAYILCITSALALGSLEASLSVDQKDNRGLRLGAGLAEAGETGIAYSVFLVFPEYLWLWLPVWSGILFYTVISRVRLAWLLQSQHQSRADVTRADA